MNQKAKVPSFLTKRPANNKKNNNETVLHDHAASRLVKIKLVPKILRLMLFPGFIFGCFRQYVVMNNKCNFLKVHHHTKILL